MDKILKGRDRRSRGWFWMDNDYLTTYARIFGPSGTAIYMSLCRHADQETQQCFPSMRLIAEENGISMSTVQRYVKIFQQSKLIAITRNKDPLKRRWETNEYTLLDKTEWILPAQSHKSQLPVAVQRSPLPVESHRSFGARATGQSHRSPQAHKDTQEGDSLKEKDTSAPAERTSLAMQDKSKKRKKYTSEEFNFLKDYLLKTWTLKGGEYPFSRVDAGMLGRILMYGLPTAMGLLDLFWTEIKDPKNKWVLDNVGRNAKGLLHMLPRLMDMSELKTKAAFHKNVMAEVPAGAEKAGDVSSLISDALHKMPPPTDHDAQRRQALDRAEEAKQMHHGKVA